MQKQKVVPQLIVAAFVAMLVVILFIVALNAQAQPKKLYPDEVRNYQGQNLSSISDFVENSIKGTQNINQTTYRLEITGLLDRNVSYSYDEVLAKFQTYQKVVTLHCVDGWSVNILWEGFLVNDLLSQAGVNPNADTVVFYAADGYSTALPLDYIRNNNILIASKMNGLTLPPERGFPFQLVAQSQYGYKWIKWITKIEVTNNPNYLGYWESRGYPNNATLR